MINTIANYIAVRKAANLTNNLNSYTASIPLAEAKKISWITYIGSALGTSIIFTIILLVLLKSGMGKKAICNIDTNSSN
jgi:hypothetical protein